jgi:ATP-dependent Clp protease ATP-binding subunit ClpC
MVVRTCTLLTRQRRGRYGIDLEWRRHGYPCTISPAVLLEVELEPELWPFPMPVRVHVTRTGDNAADAVRVDFQHYAEDVSDEALASTMSRGVVDYDDLEVPGPGDHFLAVEVFGRLAAIFNLACEDGSQVAEPRLIAPFPVTLPLPPDSRRVLARATEFAASVPIGRPTLLQALWSVDVPGNALLRRLGLSRRAVGRISPEDPDEWGLGEVVLDASTEASIASAGTRLFDSVDLARALIMNAWGELADHLASDPIPEERIEQAVAEIRPEPLPAPAPEDDVPPWAVEVAAEPEDEDDQPQDQEPQDEDAEPAASPVRAWPPQRIFGRDPDLDRLQSILIRSQRRGAFILGPPGSGKSALVGGLARLVSRDDAHPSLRGAPVVELDVDVLRDLWDQRGSAALREVLQTEGAGSGTVFVVDDLDRWIRWEHTLGDLLSVAVELKTARLLVLATAAAHGEARRVVPAIGDDMDVVTLDPLPAGACGEVLRALRSRMRRAHKVSVGADALDAVPVLAEQYLRDVASPTNSIKLLDDSCIRAQLHGDAEVTIDHVREVVERRTGVPVRGLTGREKETLRVLERELQRRVVGQERGIRAVARTIRRSRAGLGDERRPIGSFLFLGPSGVGKTELAKATAEVVFGSPENLLTLDMSEYQHQEDVWSLVGAARGFKDADLGGVLTEPVRRRPYSLVLFDEMEKAHPRVLDILLQILEEGRLTDGMGERVDFRHTIVIMTSNLAADVVRGARGEIGFVPTEPAASEAGGGADRHVHDALRGVLRPELINRIDQIVPFAPLAAKELEKIAALQLRELDARLRTRGIRIDPAPAALRWLAARGYDPGYGARPLRRLIQEWITDPLVDLLMGDEAGARTIRVDVAADGLRLTSLPAPPL